MISTEVGSLVGQLQLVDSYIDYHHKYTSHSLWCAHTTISLSKIIIFIL